MADPATRDTAIQDTAFVAAVLLAIAQDPATWRAAAAHLQSPEGIADLTFEALTSVVGKFKLLDRATDLTPGGGGRTPFAGMSPNAARRPAPMVSPQRTRQGAAADRSNNGNVQDFTDELGLSGDAARRHLRRAVPGSGGEVHHVIPLAVRSHPLVQRAARGGFNINGPGNGVRLPVSTHNGPHPLFTNAVNNKLDRILRAQPQISNVDAARILQEYAKQLQAGLLRTSRKLK